MGCHRFHLIPLGIVLVVPAPSFSQTVPNPAAAAADGRVAEWMSSEHIAPIAKIPFTAKVELETVNQLPDGTLITHKTYNRIARDTLGRTYNEGRKWIDPATNGEPQLLRVELYDPTIGSKTVLFPLTKIGRQWTSALTTAGIAGQDSTAVSSPSIGTRKNSK
jgi:hypothetical protein